jgi:hypothetical protein
MLKRPSCLFIKGKSIGAFPFYPAHRIGKFSWFIFGFFPLIFGLIP